VRGLVVAAPASGQGKTTVTLAVLRALARRGVDVRPFKAGPDYIDPRFLAAAAGREARNLDPWGMRAGTLRAVLATAEGAELALVEGVTGLFDGALDGTGSTADLAAAFGLPVVLVVDARGMGASVAALVDGFRRHRDDVDVAAVLLNRVGSARHEALLRRALAGVAEVVGCLPRDDGLVLPSRHLGLVRRRSTGRSGRSWSGRRTSRRRGWTWTGC
jgi:cobyrinic acid a,c-diamide synthase